ncbi:MAG: ABC transporter permease [Acidiferrobacteraceae bacterium]|nr:ABC transporter permease [Acidiferrobacteraceae bacterium]
MPDGRPDLPLTYRILHEPRAVFGLIVLALMLLAAVFAPWLSPHDPLEQDLLSSFLPPSWQANGDPVFLLGTDNLGRDIVSRLIYGARTALIVALVAAALAALLGTVLGMLAGFYGGKTDMLISRAVDIWMSFPAVLLSIVLVAVIGAGLHAVIIAIVIIDWTRFCRVIRAETMVQKERDYVSSAVTIGLPRVRILFQEIFPNLIPLLIVLLTLEMGIAIVVETILSFVGLSVASDTPTWGNLIQEGRQYIHQVPWLLGLPVACVVLTVLGLNALGDGIKEVIDPETRQ